MCFHCQPTERRTIVTYTSQYLLCTPGVVIRDRAVINNPSIQTIVLLLLGRQTEMRWVEWCYHSVWYYLSELEVFEEDIVACVEGTKVGFTL